MLATIDELDGALRCPRTTRPIRFADGQVMFQGADEDGELCDYLIAKNKPVLIDFDKSVIQRDDVADSGGASVVERPNHSFLAKFVKSLLSPEKKSTKRNIATFIDKLKSAAERPKVLVIGGGSVGQGLSALYDDPGMAVYAFDIYATPRVQFVADAHDIPIVDGHFDGVVIQAVLEHVLKPQRVASEIWRVLKPGGLVYAETPFMQQVHEGAYDFTRFTERGHRYLFCGFACIDSGASAGPGRTLMWAVDYFARGVFRSRMAGKIAKLTFFWAQYFDAFIPESYAMDGASGVYFLGAKANEVVTTEVLIQNYRGT
ncbi:class I SAM-dependent methyltransferase [Qipengyuania qiaonensis]|uniref:Class I SAM-dependent methyltransferase n=1 Tax=Qipengyuania qiaonensis TaxID=2867240 RepID=A0ABS7JEE6_9SPHN|nr:class I SAM-dependent methyltransferase [Qipengyuania qiaonensis]MBX7483372.1 class I SAM-dependent methyltransferase [Qipengyuania qiaonensis]